MTEDRSSTSYFLALGALVALVVAGALPLVVELLLWTVVSIGLVSMGIVAATIGRRVQGARSV